MDEAADPPGLPSSRTVLVVDDEPDVRALIADYLRARGFEVVEAENGVEALLKFRLVRPEAVVLDILMPRLGGLRALRRIRAFDQNIAVVAVTGAVDEELRRQMMAAGVSTILTKPINLKTLWKALGGDAEAGPGPPRPAAPSAAGPDLVEGAGAGRVLIVDDEDEIRAVLEQFVAKQGYQVWSVENGDAALDALDEEAPDVVLLDIHMEGLSGIDALAAIHARAPGVKVIMMSGAASFELAKETLAHGAFDFVPKPLDMKALLKTLQAAFLMKRLEVEWNVEPGA